MNNENQDKNLVHEDQVDSQDKLNIGFLQNILDVHMDLHEASYTSANFLITTTGVILTIIAIGIIPELDNLVDKFSIYALLGIGSIVATSLYALIKCLNVIKPQIENDMIVGTPDKYNINYLYYASFLPHYTPDSLDECDEKRNEFKADLLKLVADDKCIANQYAMEIYNLSYFVLKPKFKQLRLATQTFMVGIVVGIILIIISVLPIIYEILRLWMRGI